MHVGRPLSWFGPAAVLFTILTSSSCAVSNRTQTWSAVTPHVTGTVPASERASLRFEENRGQTDPRVKFLSRGKGYSVFLTSNEAVFVFQKDARRWSLSMKVAGASPRAQVSGFNQLTGKSHYLVGNDRARWLSNVPAYQRVVYSDVYTGIDLVYYGGQEALEYDFIVSPGGDPTVIRLAFEGASDKTIDARGDLAVGMPDGGVRFRKPYAYQTIEGHRREVRADYALDPITGEIGFDLASYDRSKTLVIDPVLVYSTYFGGSGTDFGLGVATDSAGNTYLTGRAGSPDFPTQNAIQPAPAGHDDAFVAKLDPAGNLIYSTYFGGSAFDQGHAVAVDASGNVHIAGATVSLDFPTVNAFQTANASTAGNTDVFVTALNPSGTSILFSTYLGGSLSDNPGGIAVDSAGIHITGLTASTNFPVLNAYQPTKSSNVDAFVTKLNTSASALVYSTYLGGTGRDEAKSIALDPSGNAYIAGQTQSSNFPRVNAFQSVFGGQEDGFVTKLGPLGTVIYSTYLGGNDQDEARGIAVDGSEHVFVTGYTRSGNFPTLNPIQPAPASGGFRDVFLTKFDPSGTNLVYSTCLGGSFHDEGVSVAIDVDGNAYVAGHTESADFPTHAPLQAAAGGNRDVFLSKINGGGSALVYSTYIGGAEFDGTDQQAVAVDPSGSAHVVGYTISTDFPTANALQSLSAGAYDAFVLKVTDPPPNQTPVVAADSGLVTANEGTTAANTGTYSDIDVGNVTITASAGNVTKTGTNSGTWSWSFTTIDGPTESQTITITANDGNGGIVTTTFALTVNNVSPAAINDVGVTDEETAVTIGVLINDIDVPADPLAVISVSSPSANGGSVTMNGGLSATYTPPLNFVGNDSFSYSISDGDGGMASAVVVVTVNAVNDAPVNTVPGPQATGSNTTLVFSSIDGNPISVADIDAGGSAVQVTLQGLSGTVTLAGTAGLTFTAGDGTADATMTLAGTIAAVNAALNGLSYNPAPSFSGVGGVTMTTNDQGNIGAGGPLTDADTVAITVGPSATVDLELTVSDSPDPVARNGSLTYTITVINTGAFSATGVTLFDNLPTKATFVSATADQGLGCTLDDSTLSCHLGSLVSGADATVTVVVLAPDKPGILINRASVAASQQDDSPSNNMEVTQTAISTTP